MLIVCWLKGLNTHSSIPALPVNSLRLREKYIEYIANDFPDLGQIKGVEYCEFATMVS